MKQTPDYGTRILAVMAAAFLLLAQFIWLMPSESFAETAGDELVVRVQYYGEIGDKIREKARFSRSELESMGSQTWYYTNITRVGTVMSMAAYGPEVLTIIDAAGDRHWLHRQYHIQDHGRIYKELYRRQAPES